MTTEEEHAATLLRPLADEPRSPSTVDVGQALIVGRRRRRNRRVALYWASTTTAILLVIGAALVIQPRLGGGVDPTGNPTAGIGPTASVSTEPRPAPGSCVVQRRMTTLEKTSTAVISSDPTGRYQIGYVTINRIRSLVVWVDGQPRLDSTKYGSGPVPELVAVNASGIAVGSISGDRDEPLVYSVDTGPVRLPGVKQGRALAINASGVIVGVDATVEQPVRWSSQTAPPTYLPVPPGHSGVATGIDDAGNIVGTVTTRVGKSQPYMWPARGDAFFLEVPAAVAERFVVMGAIHGSTAIGWFPSKEAMSGVSREPGGGDVPGVAVWRVPDGAVTYVSAIEPGPAHRGPTIAGKNPAGDLLRVEDGKITLLPGLDTPPAGELSPSSSQKPAEGTNPPVVTRNLKTGPVAIADDGRIFGNVVEPTGADLVPVIWICA